MFWSILSCPQHLGGSVRLASKLRDFGHCEFAAHSHSESERIATRPTEDGVQTLNRRTLGCELPLLGAYVCLGYEYPRPGFRIGPVSCKSDATSNSFVQRGDERHLE